MKKTEQPQIIYVEKPKSFGCISAAVIIIFIFCIVCYVVSSGGDGPQSALSKPASKPTITPQESAEITAETQRDLQKEKEKAARYVRFGWVPRDPWRIYGGDTNFAAGAGWKKFSGKVIDVQPTGILVDGEYGDIGPGHDDFNGDFFIQDFAYRASDGDILARTANYTAFESETYTYTTVLGAERTVHRLKYGTVCDVPAPSQDEVEAFAAEQKAIADAKLKSKQDADARTLKWNQEQAAQGDSFGLLRMGERYRDGNGVEKDTSKAREYLTRSAALGNDTAKDELEKLEK
jgi:TPR repeat protein